MNLKERIELITKDYIYRMNNNIKIPSWLEKQKRSVDLLSDDSRNGLYLLEEGLMEERDWITYLLTKMG